MAEQPGNDPHAHWVAEGHCPVVSSAKAWCNLPAGHDGRHGSQRVPIPGGSDHGLVPTMGGGVVLASGMNPRFAWWDH